MKILLCRRCRVLHAKQVSQWDYLFVYMQHSKYDQQIINLAKNMKFFLVEWWQSDKIIDVFIGRTVLNRHKKYKIENQR